MSYPPNCDSVLDEVTKELQRNGTVGEEDNISLIYPAATSRIFNKPLSAVIRGPSSTGKSRVVNEVLELFPPRAYVSLSSLSPKSLAYFDEPLVHRMLVVAEMSGVRDEGVDYFLRSLISEGRVSHKTVEPGPNNGAFVARTVTTEGPMGLLTTTTQKLHPENQSRMLVLKSDDSGEQTQRILAASDSCRSGIDSGGERVAAFHAFQEWLAEGNTRVDLPFGGAIGRAIRNPPVQMRRDLPKVETAIRAHALLHRATRKRDDEGRIVADIRGDYGPVRALLEPVLGKQEMETIPRPIRDTVKAVGQILSEGAQHVTNAQVAERMDMHTSGASRNIQGALEKGFLVNREPRSGVQSELVLGRPLPSEEGLLPTVEQVEYAMNT